FAQESLWDHNGSIVSLVADRQAQSPAAPASATAPQSYPIDSVFMGIGEDVRIGWWARNIGKAKAAKRQQCSFAELSVACGIAFSASEVITKEEVETAQEVKTDLQKYYRERRSLYLDVVPFAPMFIKPERYLPEFTPAASMPYPFERLIDAISLQKFDGLDEETRSILFWKYRENMSFENVAVS